MSCCIDVSEMCGWRAIFVSVLPESLRAGIEWGGRFWGLYFSDNSSNSGGQGKSISRMMMSKHKSSKEYH
ncbi:hypothetical protein MtrunA17_Chr3g0083341 [Medicago truncatula]|uniref:Uncharacterized protein n=1 Tax=Medicago truncatula TaxID=3880 RepID=A0A396IJF5_MEDTR|nr:hypothetical protein MtrunA17_Chr3g0083341 [Medicago truncatula]